MDVFEKVTEFPNPFAEKQIGQLVGIGKVLDSLEKQLTIILMPGLLTKWQEKYHPKAENLLTYLNSRPPLIIIAGDVGSGKSVVSENIGDLIARKYDIPIHAFTLGLSSRGSGQVGEMSQLISNAFRTVRERAEKLYHTNKANGAVILIIDEADSLAQGRDESQMHHEDRAGVNTVIKGIDSLSEDKIPAAVIMCTNRGGAIDPAIRRRAGAIHEFGRPDENQRHLVLTKVLGELQLNDKSIQKLVQLTGKDKNGSYGFTFSDITQRLLPAIILESFPSCGISAASAISVAEKMEPTQPFGSAIVDGK